MAVAEGQPTRRARESSQIRQSEQGGLSVQKWPFRSKIAIGIFPLLLVAIAAGSSSVEHSNKNSKTSDAQKGLSADRVAYADTRTIEANEFLVYPGGVVYNSVEGLTLKASSTQISELIHDLYSYRESDNDRVVVTLIDSRSHTAEELLTSSEVGTALTGYREATGINSGKKTFNEISLLRYNPEPGKDSNAPNLAELSARISETFIRNRIDSLDLLDRGLGTVFGTIRPGARVLTSGDLLQLKDEPILMVDQLEPAKVFRADFPSS